MGDLFFLFVPMSARHFRVPLWAYQFDQQSRRDLILKTRGQPGPLHECMGPLFLAKSGRPLQPPPKNRPGSRRKGAFAPTRTLQSKSAKKLSTPPSGMLAQPPAQAGAQHVTLLGKEKDGFSPRPAVTRRSERAKNKNGNRVNGTTS